jgi:hypothetical protein
VFTLPNLCLHPCLWAEQGCCEQCCGTTSGHVLKRFYRGKLATVVVAVRTIVCLLKQFYGWRAPAARGRSSSRVWFVEQHLYAFRTLGRQRCLAQHLCRPSAKMLTSKKSSWTAPSCGLISTLPGPRKKGDQALGRSGGGLTTKIHACVEGLGQLARLTLTGGQVHDVTQAQAPIPQSQSD